MELWVSVAPEVPVIIQLAAAAAAVDTMAVAVERQRKITGQDGLAVAVVDHLTLVVLAQEQQPKVFKATMGYVQLLGTFKVVLQP